jgi:hypothetical protein
MVRDAHDIVTELIAGKLRNSSVDSSCLKCEEAKLMECEHTKHVKSNGSISPEKIKKRKRKTFYEHMKPYQPCRRGCSVHHSPFFHAERMRQEHVARANQGHTKVMLMRVIEGRPKSAGTKSEQLEKQLHEIDMNESDLYKKMTLKRMQTAERKAKRNGLKSSPQKSLSPKGTKDKIRFDSLDTERSAE